MENIWCVFRVKPPFSNFSGVVWTWPQPSIIYYRLSRLTASRFPCEFEVSVVQVYFHTKKCFTNLLWINVLITIQVPLFEGVQWIFIVYSSIVCSLRIITELFILGKCYDKFTFVFVKKVTNLWIKQRNKNVIMTLRDNWSDTNCTIACHFLLISATPSHVSCMFGFELELKMHRYVSSQNCIRKEKRLTLPSISYWIWFSHDVAKLSKSPFFLNQLPTSSSVDNLTTSIL